jgi:hypothetical protein
LLATVGAFTAGRCTGFHVPDTGAGLADFNTDFTGAKVEMELLSMKLADAEQ